MEENDTSKEECTVDMVAKEEGEEVLDNKNDRITRLKIRIYFETNQQK